MDLFFYLPDNIRTELFHFDIESVATLVDKINQILLEGQHSSKKLSRLSTFGLERLPVQQIKLEHIKNPYSRWRRLKNKKSFGYGNWRRSVPNGKLRKDLKPDVAYIVQGYEASGAYASVNTFVVFNGHKCVIKYIDENESDWFELVSHAYMYQISLSFSNIRVPKLMFMQLSPRVDRFIDESGIRRAERYMVTEVCMERAEGIPFANLEQVHMLTGLAHAMKAIYQLQKTTHFIHRDLSGQNIMYDPISNKITFIDFGMTCINPKLSKLSWQKKDDDFYISEPGSHAAMCTNRSLDPCVLIAHLSKSHPWCAAEHRIMKQKYKETIETSENTRAKKNLQSPRRHENQFTTIRPGDWTVGNELRPWDAKTQKGDGWHWWLFNMIEFPVEDYFPEKILSRLLKVIPLDDWFAIRKGWSADFDEFMPKDSQVQLKDGRTGIIQKLSRHKLDVLVESELVKLDPQECELTDYLKQENKTDGL